MLDITWVGMTRPHFQPGAPGRVRMVVLHATAGTSPGDLAWLRKGGDPRRPVSCHYHIDKAGAIRQLVRDADIAWHAGRSRWLVDGRVVDGCNAVSIGIELENRNDGRDPYPAPQYAAAVALTRALSRAYDVPRSQLVRHLDISPGRKTDPAGFPWQHFVAEVYGLAPALAADSPILAPPPAGLTPERLGDAAWALCVSNGEYTQGDVAGAIVPAYWQACLAGGVSPLGAVAQCLHETGNLRAALSHRRDKDGRPLRNPAGIGVTGAASSSPRPGYVWDADAGLYRAAVGFAAWAGAGGAIEAHVGRLIAYATRPEARTPEQARLVAAALAARALGDRCQGSAPTWRALGTGPNPVAGCGWAGKDDTEGWHYGERVAAKAALLWED